MIVSHGQRSIFRRAKKMRDTIQLVVYEASSIGEYGMVRYHTFLILVLCTILDLAETYFQKRAEVALAVSAHFKNLI